MYFLRFRSVLLCFSKDLPLFSKKGVLFVKLHIFYKKFTKLNCQIFLNCKKLSTSNLKRISEKGFLGEGLPEKGYLRKVYLQVI